MEKFSNSRLAETFLAEAWIGDGVLALWARLRVLADIGSVCGEQYTRLTSNQFLNAFGEPTSVEASIGRLYTERGLQAAFEWMDGTLLPLFRKQQANRVRKGKI